MSDEMVVGEATAGVQRFIERSPLAIGLVDAETRFIGANQRLYDLIGHPVGSLQGQPGIDYAHPDDLGTAAANLARLLAGEMQSITTDVRIRDAEGGYRLLRLAITDLVDDPGIGGLLIVAEPVEPGADTPRRSAWFEAMLARASDFAAVIDAEGRLLYVHGAAVGPDVLNAFVGRSVFDIVPEVERARLRVWFDEVVARPGAHEPRYLRSFDADGADLVLEVRPTNLLHDPDVGAVFAICRDVSELRVAQTLTRTAEIIVEHSPLMVGTADGDGRITSWNPAAERQLGWSADEAIGRRMTEIGGFSESALSVFYDGLPLLVQGGSFEVETTLRNRAGEEFPVFLQACGLRDSHGEVDGFLVLGLDLRDLHAAHSAAERSERRWETIFRHTRELVALIDDEGTGHFVGQGFDRLLGHAPASLTGTNLLGLVHPDDRTALPRLFDGEGRLVRPGRAEYRIRHADGSYRVFDMELTDRRDDPTIGAYLLNGIDVSERVTIEGANRRMAEAIESAGAIVTITDLRGAVLSFNRGAERVLGLTDDHVGDAEAVLDLVPERHADQRHGLFELVAAGESAMFETQRMGADGRTIELTAIVSPVLDPGGQVVGASWIAFDVTTQRQAEREGQRRAQQQTVVAEIGHRALAGAGVDDLLAEACESVAATLGVDHAHVLLVGADGSDLELVSAVGPLSHLVGVARRPLSEAFWCDEARVSGRPVVYEDLSEVRDRLPSAFEAAPVTSGVLVAMEGRSGLIGALTAYSTTRHTFSDDDLAFLEAVSVALTTAVERRRVDDEMRRRALHDELTGLPNRTLFVDRLTQALGRRSRRGERLALLFVDLDRFKRVNDTLGHAAGDEVLSEAARRLSASVRLGDTVARVGGDEFLVLCEDVSDEAEATALAERIGNAVRAPIPVGDHPVVVTASIGIALADATSDAESLVSDADLAMYRAKQRGRSRAELYDQEMRDEVVSRLAIEEALRRAVDRDAINIVYQPVVDMVERRVVGVEALARWRDDIFGDVAPPAFLAVAEEAGLGDELGGLILRAAAATAARIRATDSRMHVSVNVSARQLAGSRLTEQIEAVLADTGLPPDALVIELTETDVLDDSHAGPAIDALRAIGVGVSIDDFGTGYSSLQRVARLPVDEVKIDQSFVAGLGKDRGADAVVRAAITLADSLGMRLVAEGIERPDQLEHLKSLGCRYGQGWLFTSPLAAPALLDWLASPTWDRRSG